MTRVRSLARREGFALLTVLWVVAAFSVVGAATTVDSRDALQASRNRVWLERAAWLATGCAAIAQGAVDDALRSTPDPLERNARWRALPRHVEFRTGQMPADCHVTLVADGNSLNINRASESALLAYFDAVGLGAERVDLVGALRDWIDSDDSLREGGAESSYYAAAGRVGPRNGLIADTAELRLISGFEHLPSRAFRGLGTSTARISINTALPEVLATLPGFSAELAARVLERVLVGDPMHDLAGLEGLASTTAAETVRENFGSLVSAATVDPEAWVVTATARVGNPAVVTTLELRLIRNGSGTAVSRRRTW